MLRHFSAYLLLSAFLCLASGCGQPAEDHTSEEIAGADEVNTEVAKFYGEVMAEHDVAMAKMESTHDLRNKLNQRKAQLDSTGSKKAFLAKRNQIDTLIARLEMADKGMMQWMRNLPAVDEMSEDAAMSALEKEKTRIHQVDQDFDSVILHASEYLDEE